MTGNDAPDCARLRDNAAELALGILPARERAAAMIHLQRCPACLEHVRELARTADELLDLIPGSEPPLGFETRALRRLGLPPQRRRRSLRQRVALGAAAVAAATALAAGGWAVGVTTMSPTASPPSPTGPAQAGSNRLVSADLTAQGNDVGRVFAYTGSSPWLYMSVNTSHLPPGNRAALDGNVTCQVERADGSRSTVGSFSLDYGYSHWAAPYPAGSAPVTGVRLLTADGSVLATAALPARS